MNSCWLPAGSRGSLKFNITCWLLGSLSVPHMVLIGSGPNVKPNDGNSCLIHFKQLGPVAFPVKKLQTSRPGPTTPWNRERRTLEAIESNELNRNDSDQSNLFESIEPIRIDWSQFRIKSIESFRNQSNLFEAIS
jgi:hypothetical protein